jgi:hypothetical protein
MQPPRVEHPVLSMGEEVFADAMWGGSLLSFSLPRNRIGSNWHFCWGPDESAPPVHQLSNGGN